MKTSSILFAAVFLLLPWCHSPLFSQSTNLDSPKKITIIKRTIEADGSEVTETIVKKGKAAENFDVDKYVQENKGGKNEVEIIVEKVDGDNNDLFNIVSQNRGYSNWGGCNNNNTFLGVSEDSDEDEDAPGLVVQITRGSAADKAGLRDNDKILTINGTAMDRWSDLTAFINAAKAGDKVKIEYSRNGKKSTTEAILTTRNEVKCDNIEQQRGFMGISDEDDDDDAPGVAVSVNNNSRAAKAGLKDGDVIFQLNDVSVSDFEDISDVMAYTKPEEKMLVRYERDGKMNTTDVILGAQGAIAVTYDLNAEPFGGAFNGSSNLSFPAKIDCTTKEKEACLGVYSNAYEDRGAALQSFTRESAAQEAGMLEGDVILSINNNLVDGHSTLWDEISKYKTGEKVQVAFEREGKSMQVEATLKACRDNQSRVEILDRSINGENLNRRFYTWNWEEKDQRRLSETRIIIIRRAGDGDGAKVNLSPATAKPAEDRSLKLESFKAFPNPSSGQITVEFQGEPVATVVSLLDISGRQLFREELNAFNGAYNQQFDLTAYAKGTIIVHIQQGDKIFTDQIIVN
jgi:S1-C subfamily serine protease